MISEKPPATGRGKGPANAFDADEVRPDWVPKEDYTSAEFAELERKYLWPRIWQVACREEDLPKVGSFVTYEILDESVIVIRTRADEIKAYNNACLHRGRRLTEGEGRTGNFVCKFHGWTWGIDGANKKIVDQEDWGGCLKSEDLHLHEFKVGLWGGFVFINMDADCESFEDFLGDIPERLDCMEFQNQRYRWYVSVEVQCNWKTAQEAFHEAYHAQTTHKGIEPYVDSRSGIAYARGRHGQLVRNAGEQVIGRYETGPGYEDQRQSFVEAIRIHTHAIQSIYTDRDLQAACRILTELPPTATWAESAVKAYEFMKEAAVACGAGYPELTRAQVLAVGNVSTLFPNTSNVLGSVTGGLWYRFRPVPSNDPNRCIFDIYSLERFTPGSEPKVEKKTYSDWSQCKDMPPFLLEDFGNMPDVQRGMRTKFWKGARTNPILERIVSNGHHALRAFIHEGVERDQQRSN